MSQDFICGVAAEDDVQQFQGDGRHQEAQQVLGGLGHDIHLHPGNHGDALVTPALGQDRLELLPLHDDDVGEHAQGNTRHHRGHDEDDRHERRHPQGVGLDRAEDETGIAVQETGHRDTDGGQDGHRPVVLGHGLLADVKGAQGQHGVEHLLEAVTGRGRPAQGDGLLDKIAAVDKPDLAEHDDRHTW